jgi:hypothetical protein
MAVRAHLRQTAHQDRRRPMTLNQLTWLLLGVVIGIIFTWIVRDH